VDERPAEIDPARRDLIERFRRTLIGRRRPDLRLLLNRIWTSEGDNACLLICSNAHREWRLARKSMSPITENVLGRFIDLEPSPMP
jgi:hypothetical protein